ncbi:unnamed protein product [Miscanthus lutarioriparius]|uniref:Uncharacterized protein n=1 Tax=Miscanthus lutarioriparius TaxID=422564 RepID=A0A811QF19_9POAL|nr:unnamed protein product [Miscanthus lutarioriparius]
MMDSRLLDAAASGDATMMKHLALHDPAVLLGTTPQGNTCLHISAVHGHDGFCMDVTALSRSLLSAVNNDRETPLVAAVTSGRTSTTLASSFLSELALELIAVEPALSKAVNKYDESPMFIAVMRNYKDVSEKLLEIPDSAHGGMEGQNALHAAVRNGNSAIAKQIKETRPALATEEDTSTNTPLHLAVLRDKIDVLSVLLDHDRSLGGHVGVARELLKH